VLFLSCKAKARVKLAKTWHGTHSSTLVVICVVRLLFVLFYVLFVCKCVLPPGDNPIAVNKYININSVVLVSNKPMPESGYTYRMTQKVTRQQSPKCPTPPVSFAPAGVCLHTSRLITRQCAQSH